MFLLWKEYRNADHMRCCRTGALIVSLCDLPVLTAAPNHLFDESPGPIVFKDVTVNVVPLVIMQMIDNLYLL